MSLSFIELDGIMLYCRKRLMQGRASHNACHMLQEDAHMNDKARLLAKQTLVLPLVCLHGWKTGRHICARLKKLEQKEKHML